MFFAGAAIAAHWSDMEGLTIIKKIEDMIGYGYLCIRYFPKSERFVMGADIRESMLSMLSMLSLFSKPFKRVINDASCMQR